MTKEQLKKGNEISKQIECLENFLSDIKDSSITAVDYKILPVNIPKQLLSSYWEAMDKFKQSYIEELTRQIDVLETVLKNL